MAAAGRELLPATLGTVRSWKDDKGWGVIVADGSQERVWTHFSSVEAPGHRSLNPGERVWLVAERPGQDSYPLRAVAVRRLDLDGQPIVPAPEAPDTSDAFTSRLTIRWDDGTVDEYPAGRPRPWEGHMA